MRRFRSIALLLVAACAGDDPTDTSDTGDAGDPFACPEATGDTITFPDAKLYFEHNATDADTGVHGLFDAEGWKTLCAYDPSGNQILSLHARGQFTELGLSELFFESREPPNVDMPIAELLEKYPEGTYTLRGTSWDGVAMVGEADFTHDIPAAPVITEPAEDTVVPITGLVVSWDPVTTTLFDGPLELTGYELIVVNEDAVDPHGNSAPEMSVHVRPGVTSLAVPDGFLEPGTNYAIEVLALEVSGNQTISSIFFSTEE